VKIWVDAQLSPVIAQWLSSTYGVEAVAVRDLRLRDARDRDIFLSAREAKAIILTKDSDMVDLVTQLGSPPQILWLTCGNTSNAKLKTIFTKAWPAVENLLEAGEKIVEISDTTG
jgi:predicted nuclease of predicted toxin-antitoxin system